MSTQQDNTKQNPHENKPSHSLVASSSQGNRLRNIKWLTILLLVLTALYVNSFLLVRQRVTYSFVIPGDQPATVASGSLRVYYFSSDLETNQKLYWLYYPLHQWILGGASDSDLLRESAYIQFTRQQISIYCCDLDLVEGLIY